MWGRTLPAQLVGRGLPRFPIRYLDAAWKPSNPEDGKPFMSVALQSLKAGQPEIVTEALVDTGAQLNALSPQIIDQLGHAWVMPSRSTTGSGVVESGLHQGKLTLGQFDITTQFSAIDFRAAGNYFDLVLGGLFLRLGVLHMDFRRGEHWFELPDAQAPLIFYRPALG